MKYILKLTILLLLTSIKGCEEKDKQAHKPEPAEFKTQLEALEKAKQVEQILQNEAAQQRKMIDESTNNQKQ